MTTDSPFLKTVPIIDSHVHIVGTGAGGTGCWMRPKGWHRPLASLMLRHIGMDPESWKGDFDRLYLERLLYFVGTSSLSHVVILAQDHVYEANGERMEGRGSFYVPNHYVLSLAEKHPQLLPAVSIHPARKDAFEELDQCLTRGAVMMKCLPNCHNIDCSDRRYQRFWERMAEAGLPLLAHTGGEHTVPVIRREFADPRILELPLQCGVTVIAAHCGTKSGLFDPDYFNIFVKMTERFPNFYGDTSAFNVPIRGRHIPDCLQRPIRQRVLHGSDYPVPVNGHFAWMRGLVSWEVFRRWQKQPNVLERDYQLKKAMGFSDESFGRVGMLLRKKR